MAKWKAQAAEWRRLSTLTDNARVAAVCIDQAELADTMTRFWEKWK